MESEAPKAPFIKVMKGKFQFGFTYHAIKDGDMYSCYIPAFDIYFSCNADPEILNKRATSAVKSFFSFWFKKEGAKAFFLEIHKLGFRTENDAYNLKRLLNKEIFNTKFQADSVLPLPEGFEDSKVLHSEEESVLV